MIQEAYVHGVSTRAVDDLVKAMGGSGVSKSQVSRLCAPFGKCRHLPAGQGEIDERVKAKPGAKLDRDYLRAPRKPRRPARRTITFDGKTLTIEEWAARIGMSRQALHLRIKAGWPLERALTEARPKTFGPSPRTITFNGETLTVPQWAARIGISHDAIRNRLLKGWTLEQALTEGNCNTPPSYAATRVFTFNGESLTLVQWSKRANITLENIRARIKIGWTEEDAILTPYCKLRGWRLEAPKISQH